MIDGLSKKPFPADPPSIGDLIRETERPLTAEETAGFAVGDPFKEHGLPEEFTKVIADGLARPDRHENAAGKKLCGMCDNKVGGKGWRCSKLSLSESGPGIPTFTCPAPNGNCPGFVKKPSIIRSPQPKKKGPPVPPGVKYMYFGRPRDVRLAHENRARHDHNGVVTVAWSTPEPGILHLGFSFCSPKDRWCKAKGRDMALRRLLKPLDVPYLYDAKRTAREVVRAVLSHDFGLLESLCGPGTIAWGHTRVPSWTRALAKRMWPPKDFHRIPTGLPFSIDLSGNPKATERDQRAAKIWETIVNQEFQRWGIPPATQKILAIMEEIDEKMSDYYALVPHWYKSTAEEIIARMRADIANLAPKK